MGSPASCRWTWKWKPRYALLSIILVTTSGSRMIQKKKTSIATTWIKTQTPTGIGVPTIKKGITAPTPNIQRMETMRRLKNENLQIQSHDAERLSL
jgi:hypothetical protein